jgi:hypothetical protein
MLQVLSDCGQRHRRLLVENGMLWLQIWPTVFELCFTERRRNWTTTNRLKNIFATAPQDCWIGNPLYSVNRLLCGWWNWSGWDVQGMWSAWELSFRVGLETYNEDMVYDMMRYGVWCDYVWCDMIYIYIYIWFDIVYDVVWYMIWYDVWCDMIYIMIYCMCDDVWYDIYIYIWLYIYIIFYIWCDMVYDTI